MSEQEPRPRQRSFNSVSTKIISFVFASTFLTALVVSWISIQSSHAPLQLQIDLLERWEETVQAELDRSVAELADLRPGLAAAIRVNHAGPRTQRAFRAFVAGSHRFDALGLLGPNQQWLARVGATERLSAAAKLDWPGGGADLAEPPASDAAPVTFARLPLADTEWLLVAALRPEALAGLLSSETQRTGSELFLLDGAGRVLAASPPGQGDREQRPSGVRSYTGSNGHHLLASARPVGSLGWTLVVEESFEVAFEPVLSMLTPIFLTDLAIVLVFSVLAWRIKSTILRPIEALSEGARRVSQGQMDHEIPDPGSGDEIGLLTRTFNDMVRKLRHNQLEIEEANFRLTEQYEELLSANEVLAQLSITDGLTKLHNHRYFQDHLTREIKRVGRSGEPLSMLLMDLDDFKSLNDRLGHAAGDELLVKISKVMNTSVRESDLLARYGGEEFVVLASGTELEGGVALAEKIRTAVAETPHIVDSSMRPVRLTISVGVAAYEGDRMKFFRDADRALYEAKAEGKNCVVAASREICHPSDMIVGMTVIVGLSGGIGSGKSTVSKLFEKLGAVLVDADAIVHELQAPGEPMLDEIAAAFGPEMIDASGALDRAAVAAIVFRDEQARIRLGEIVHPPVVAEMMRRSKAAADAEAPVVVVDIPLLFEGAKAGRGAASVMSFDATVAVWVPAEVQIERTVSRDGCDRDEAKRRVDAQLPIDEKREMADYVIDNSGPAEATERQVRALFDALTHRDSEAEKD